MQTILLTLAPPALIGFVLILPFIVLEIVNRRGYAEDFPAMLFLGLWLNLFAIGLVLLPVWRGWRASARARVETDLARRKTLLGDPGSAALVSLALFLALGILFFLDSRGWVAMDALINGPDPTVVYIPGLFVTLALFAVTVAAGVIASAPVAGTLRAGGSLFAHPLNLLIVAVYVSVLAFGAVSLVVDQWPCFMGVPVCD